MTILVVFTCSMLLLAREPVCSPANSVSSWLFIPSLIALHVPSPATVHISESALTFQGENKPDRNSERRGPRPAAVEGGPLAVLPESISENYPGPASLRYQVKLRGDTGIGRDGRSIAVMTELTSVQQSRTYYSTNQPSWHTPSRQDLKGSRLDL